MKDIRFPPFVHIDAARTTYEKINDYVVYRPSLHTMVVRIQCPLEWAQWDFASVDKLQPIRRVSDTTIRAGVCRARDTAFRSCTV